MCAKIYCGRTTQTIIIAQKRTASQKELCVENKGTALTVVQKFSTSWLVDSRNGDVLQRARQDGRRQDGSRRTIWFTN